MGLARFVGRLAPRLPDPRLALVIVLALAALLPLAPALLPLLRLLDSGICAQQPTHMLTPGGVALPLCARCTGIYTGAALGYALLTARGRLRASRPPSRLLIALLLGAIAVMGFDGLNSVANDLGIGPLYPPSNAVRLATGLLAGTALALLLAPVVAGTLFGAADDRPPLDGVPGLLPFAVAGVVAFGLIWNGAAWLLYPVALVSNAGLLLILGSANVALVHALTRRTPLAANVGALAPLLLLAGGACLAELSILANMRIALLG